MGSMWGRPAAPPPWPAGSGAPRWAATPKSAPRTAPARGPGGGYFWARWRQTCFWYGRAPSTPERHSGCELWGQGGANRILCHTSHLSSRDKEVYSENLRRRWTLFASSSQRSWSDKVPAQGEFFHWALNTKELKLLQTLVKRGVGRLDGGRLPKEELPLSSALRMTPLPRPSERDVYQGLEFTCHCCPPICFVKWNRNKLLYERENMYKHIILG